MSAHLIIVMGVSGCGKSTLASALARKYSYHFIEADNFHSAQAKAQMASGTPLNDAQRAPWINALQKTLRQNQKHHISCVLSFSGLRSAHRNAMRNIFEQTVFLHLDLPKGIILKRLNSRQAHFMPTSLLDSQFAALQPTSSEADVFRLNAVTTITQTIDQSVELLAQQLRITPKPHLRML